MCSQRRSFQRVISFLSTKANLSQRMRGIKEKSHYEAELGSFLFFFKDESKCLWYVILTIL